MIFTLFAMSLVPPVGLLQILRIEAYYRLPWVSKHTAQKTELAWRTLPSRTGVSKIATWSSFRASPWTPLLLPSKKNVLPKTNMLHKKNRDVPLAPRQPLPGEGSLTTRQSSNQERDIQNVAAALESRCTVNKRGIRDQDRNTII